jgi:hypothetical protein
MLLFFLNNYLNDFKTPYYKQRKITSLESCAGLTLSISCCGFNCQYCCLSFASRRQQAAKAGRIGFIIFTRHTFGMPSGRC